MKKDQTMYDQRRSPENNKKVAYNIDHSKFEGIFRNQKRSESVAANIMPPIISFNDKVWI